MAVLAVLWRKLHLLPDDLFPICTKGVASFLLHKGSDIANAVACTVNSLNYLALHAGGGAPARALPERKLTQSQKFAVQHLVAEHLQESGAQCPSLEEASRDLGAARFDYGEPVMPLEELVAEKVIQASPRVGEAAIQMPLIWCHNG